MIPSFFDSHPAEIQVDSTELIEYSYKPSEVIIESLRYKFLSMPIEERAKAGLQDSQWLRYQDDVDEIARGLAMPSFEHLDLVSEHKADGINYLYDTLVLTYALPIDDLRTGRSMDFHAVKFWWEGDALKWTTKVYMTYEDDSLCELKSLGVDFEYANNFGIGYRFDDEEESVTFVDEYFYLKGSDCASIWNRLGFERPSVPREDNGGRGLFAITVKKSGGKRTIVKLKRYYYPDDPRLEKAWS